MRQLFVAAVAAAVLAFGLSPAYAGKVEISGAHLCCNQCKNIAKAILGKIEGVSDAAADKTITFTSKDEKATQAAVKALTAAGYYGTVKDDGKEVKIELPTPKAEKADTVTVKNVHVCCGNCKTAINKLFPEAKVEYGTAGENKITEIKINGKGLDKAEVIKTLRGAGFNGSVE
jgi:hypothetical protein